MKKSYVSRFINWCLGSALPLVAIFLVADGCRSSRESTENEGFFEPLKSVNRPAEPKQQVKQVQKPSAWDRMADSLLKRQREQEERIGALTGQLKRLESAGKSGRMDSASTRPSRPTVTPKTVEQPVVDSTAEIIRQYETGQYKAASEGLRGLLQRGVPRGVESRYRYMLGVCHFKLRQFDLAAASLKIVSGWKGSSLRADAFFVLGQIYRELGAGRQATAMFEAVLKSEPTAALADAARQQLKGLAARK